MKYRNKTLGFVVENTGMGDYTGAFVNEIYTYPRELVEKSSCDWEKVEENPWFISKIGPSKVTGTFFYFIKDGLYSSNPEAITGTVSAPTLIQEGWNIHTVSNGKEEFSLHEWVKSNTYSVEGEIISFIYTPDRPISITIRNFGKEESMSIDLAKLVKRPILYITEDGVNRYKSQDEWWIQQDKYNKWSFCPQPRSTMTGGVNLENSKVFSTKEAAELWMSSHNPKQYWVSRIIGVSSGFTYCGTSPSTTTIYGYQTQNLSFSSEQEAKDFIDNNQKKYSIEDIKKAVHSMWGQTIPLDVIKLQEAVIKNLKNGTN